MCHERCDALTKMCSVVTSERAHRVLVDGGQLGGEVEHRAHLLRLLPRRLRPVQQPAAIVGRFEDTSWT